MATVKLFINEKSTKKNGEAAIYLIVHIEYKSLKFNSGVSCNPKNWDAGRNRIKGKSQKINDDNLIIQQCRARMNDIFVRYRLQHVHLSPTLLKNEWKNPARRIDFFAFFGEALAERKSELAPGTYKHHKSVINILKTYKNKLAFSEITPELLISFQRWLKAKPQNNDINTIHGKMRVFRTYINIAIRKGIITESPFNQIKLKLATVNRVYLSAEELKILWRKYNSKSLPDTQQKVLRHFLFMCFTAVRISDLKLLTHDNIISDMLVYNAYKNRRIKRNMIKVPLNIYTKQLITDEKNTGDLLFATISEQRMNEYIKNIANEAEIHKEVTNHSGRHTFATLWLEKTTDLAQLQVLMGHSNIRQTMVYVHITDSGLKKQMDNFEANIFT